MVYGGIYYRVVNGFLFVSVMMNGIFQFLFALVITICINGILHERKKHKYPRYNYGFTLNFDSLQSARIDSLIIEAKKANEF